MRKIVDDLDDSRKTTQGHRTGTEAQARRGPPAEPAVLLWIPGMHQDLDSPPSPVVLGDLVIPAIQRKMVGATVIGRLPKDLEIDCSPRGFHSFIPVVCSDDGGGVNPGGGSRRWVQRRR